MAFKIIFFDCDGVLTLKSNWARFHKALNISRKVDEKWHNQFYEGKLTFSKWASNLQNLYLSKKLNYKLFSSSLDKITINNEAVKLVKFLKQKNIKTAVISSGIDYYVKKIAYKLKMDYWKANVSLVFNNQGKFKKINYLAPDQKAKVLQIKQICKMLKVKPINTMFIGDSINDLKAFQLTKHGILYIHNDHTNHFRSKDGNLKNIAWKTVTSLMEIKKLL